MFYQDTTNIHTLHAPWGVEPTECFEQVISFCANFSTTDQVTTHHVTYEKSYT